MPQFSANSLGILPSLEVLPFFADGFNAGRQCDDLPMQLKPYSSYGEIARGLLTRNLMGGIIPWEIFIADILALPGQRACWKIPLFLQACPTELVLREAVYKAFYPPHSALQAKPPQHLRIGIENQHSLTKVQLLEWLGNWKDGLSTKITFTMLPMETRIQAFQAGSLDAMIARSPWGIHAESTGLGKRDLKFSPSKYHQRLVLVCHRDFLEEKPHLSQELARSVTRARTQLKDPATFSKAIENMAHCGKPFLRAELLEKAADLHSFATLADDMVPDVRTLVAELMMLDDLAILPSQVSASEQTARLLIPA